MDEGQLAEFAKNVLGYLFVFTFVLPVSPFLLLEIYHRLNR
jgi:hypothetical protein